jgi:hypothetical protein
MTIGSQINLSLLDKNGGVHLKGGLNWGFSKGNVCLEDAYIPLHVSVFINNPGFFEPIGADNRIHVTWDDNTEMELLLEGRQSNLINGQLYAKQISSDEDKSILGNYIRRRISVQGRRIILQDLINYGRTDITVTRNSINSYHFNFL